LPPSTNKRVIIYRFHRQPLAGIVNPANYLRERHLEMITKDGILERLPYEEVKAVCFVAEEGKANLFSESTVFERRPRLAGIWARFTFSDGDRLDGILPHSLLDWPEQGYSLTPPRAGPGRQRVFLPRMALSSAELLGVVGASAKVQMQTKKGPTRPDVNQINMFDL
jgi:hypothetical protein